MFQDVKNAYEGLIATVIRPYRAEYAINALGPYEHFAHKVKVVRNDFQLKNDANLTLECCWWKAESHNSNTPVIIVLHGNSSCRVGALDILKRAIQNGFSVIGFDFSGSGHSEGKYVSLGYHESSDVSTVIKHLKTIGFKGNISLWGRSMGAVAAMLCVEKETSITAMVLDSPFAKLSKLATDLVDDGKLPVPKIGVHIVMRMVRNTVKKRAKFDMYDLNPINNIHKCTVPAFFAVATHDELVGKSHGEDLHEKHGGPKKLLEFDGEHNSVRPEFFYQQAMEFLQAMNGIPISKVDAKQERLPVFDSTCKVTRSPLLPNMKMEDIQTMKIQELIAAIKRSGFCHRMCVERSELISLVERIERAYNTK